MLGLLGIELDGEPVKRERPDFLLKLRDGRTVGVELVRAINERVAAGRGTRARLKQGVKSGLVAAGLNAWVTVRLNENVAAMLNDDAAALKREVAAIVELARRTMANSPEDRWYNYEWIDHSFEEMMGRRRSGQRDSLDLEGTGVEHADAVGIHPHTEPLATWSVHGGGQQPSIVQEAIDGKVVVLAEYRRCGADEIWLLVIGSAGTGGALFVEDVEGRQFVSPYDRTIFLELYQARCVKLNTTTEPFTEAS